MGSLLDISARSLGRDSIVGREDGGLCELCKRFQVCLQGLMTKMCLKLGQEKYLTATDQHRPDNEYRYQN